MAKDFVGQSVLTGNKFTGLHPDVFNEVASQYNPKRSGYVSDAFEGHDAGAISRDPKKIASDHGVLGNLLDGRSRQRS